LKKMLIPAQFVLKISSYTSVGHGDVLTILALYIGPEKFYR